MAPLGPNVVAFCCRARRTVKVPTIVSNVYAEFSEDRIPAVAGGVTFFFLLAMFPALASVVSLYGFLADRQSILGTLQMMSGFLPGGAVTVLGAEIHRLADEKPATLNFAFFLSTIVALWSTGGGIQALLDSLNIAFETKETRGFFHLTLHAIIFAAGAVTTGAIVIYGLGQVRRIVESLSWASYARTAFLVFVWPVAFIVCSTVVSLIYRYGPNRARTPWRWISWGSAFASVFWIIGTLSFSWYVQNFGSYNRTYGGLGAAVGFLTWIWISIVILLTGAEITCECEKAAESSALD
jgi:membrane protein